VCVLALTKNKSIGSFVIGYMFKTFGWNACNLSALEKMGPTTPAALTAHHIPQH
jgi:hypothetical protein